MNTISKFWKLGLVVGFISAGLASCGDDKKKEPDEPDGFQCDPAGANPAMGTLLNATLASDVEVIVKTPTHPGDPGPLNLP